MRRTLGQLLRYGLVGIASNALAYVSYLALTGAGMGHLSAMTLVYALATLLTFLFNRRWSFGHSGGRGPALARYGTAYLLGYAIDWFGLWLLVDRLGYPHQLAQGIMVVIVAGFLFLLLKHWVFGISRQGPN
jgi:putative flippase GtrA